MIESLRTTQIAFFRFATPSGFLRGEGDETRYKKYSCKGPCKGKSYETICENIVSRYQTLLSSLPRGIKGGTNSRIHPFLPQCIAFNQSALRSFLPECIAPRTTQIKTRGRAGRRECVIRCPDSKDFFVANFLQPG